MRRISAALLATPLALLAPTARAEDGPGFFSRLGAALDRGLVRGRELAAEGAEQAGRGLQEAGDATRSAAERLARQLRERSPESPPAAPPRQP
jgi:hypothetical protein